MSEVESCVNTSFASCRQEVGNERKRVSVLFRDFVKAAIIHAKSESSIIIEAK